MPWDTIHRYLVGCIQASPEGNRGDPPKASEITKLPIQEVQWKHKSLLFLLKTHMLEVHKMMNSTVKMGESHYMQI